MATRGARSRTKGANAGRAKKRTAVRADPFHIHSIPPNIYAAFHALYKALYRETHAYSIAMEREEDRRQVGDDPEVLIARMKQFKRAAEVVNALRVALEKGPEESLHEPFDWARTVTAVNPPLDPKKKLAPYKDWMIEEVRRRMVALTREKGADPDDAGEFKEAARAFARQADALRVDGDQERSGAQVNDLAHTIAVFPVNANSGPALDRLRRGSIAERTRAVVEAMRTLGQHQWEEPEIILKHAFVAMGMPASEADNFFSYRDQRVKRRRGGEDEAARQ